METLRCRFTAPCWCEHCAALRPVEHFNDTDWTQEEINEIDAELAQLTDAWFKRLCIRLFNSNRGHRKWLEERRLELRGRLALIERRVVMKSV